MESRAELEARGVRFVRKGDSRLMWLIGKLLFFVPHFSTRFWTTIGRTIYYPDYVEDPLAQETVVRHELIHVAQFERWGAFFMLAYLLFPLPVGLAWFRWRWEREAYLVNLRAGAPLDFVVFTLWNNYGWCWPKSWMRKWFQKNL